MALAAIHTLAHARIGYNIVVGVIVVVDGQPAAATDDNITHNYGVTLVRIGPDARVRRVVTVVVADHIGRPGVGDVDAVAIAQLLHDRVNLIVFDDVHS